MQDNKKTTEIRSVLNPEEEMELARGKDLRIMVEESPGWKIVSEWLTSMAYHTWVDPRETSSRKEWEWRELNAFHASNNAKELLDNITEVISRAEYLDKVKRGEIDRKKMQI